MPKARPTEKAIARERAERPGLYKELSEINAKLNRIESQNQVIIIKLAGHEKETAQLQLSIKGLCQTLLELIEQPESIHHAEAIVRDWLIKLHKK